MRFGDLKAMLNHTTETLNGRSKVHTAVNGKAGGETISTLVENLDRSFFPRGDFTTTLDAADRDLSADCGYPLGNPYLEQYREMYEQEGAGTRVVNLLPNECWRVYPEWYEREDDRITISERETEKLNLRIPLAHYFHRADRMSRIGHYGGLFFGYSDLKSFDQPAKRSKDPRRNQLAYLRPFAEWDCQIASYDNDDSSPRYGQALYYNVNFASPVAVGSQILDSRQTMRLMKVHWTRMLHVADNRDGSEIFGVPAMQVHFRRLLDLRKVYAGSAEMYWQGAFPGFTFDAFPDMADDAELDIESVQETLQAYMNHLQRWLASTGGTFRSLAPQVVNPTPQVMCYISIICAVMGCPIPIFMGSETGVLASAENKEIWNGRVSERQRLYCEPWIIRPFFERCWMLGILPRPKQWLISWRDLNTVSDKDKADVALKRVQALLQYCSSGAEKILPLHFLNTIFLGMSQSEADAVLTEITAADKAGKYITKELWTATASAAKNAAAQLQSAQTLKQQKQKTGNEKIRSPQGKVKKPGG